MHEAENLNLLLEHLVRELIPGFLLGKLEHFLLYFAGKQIFFSHINIVDVMCVYAYQNESNNARNKYIYMECVSGYVPLILLI